MSTSRPSEPVVVGVGVAGVGLLDQLLAVLEPVAVGVGLAGIGLGPELGAVVELVAVLVALVLLDLQRELVALLPAVGEPVLVAVLGQRRGGEGDQEQRGELAAMPATQLSRSEFMPPASTAAVHPP